MKSAGDDKLPYVETPEIGSLYFVRRILFNRSGFCVSDMSIKTVLVLGLNKVAWGNAWEVWWLEKNCLAYIPDGVKAWYLFEEPENGL